MRREVQNTEEVGARTYSLDQHSRGGSVMKIGKHQAETEAQQE
jgi:hypothetical protein